MIKENPKERNLAYQRAAYQSSSYTVNETVQLVTTGEKEADESKMAYEFLHRDGNRSRYGNVKYLFDSGTEREFQTYTTNTWVQVRLPRKTVLGSYTLTAGTKCSESEPFPSSFYLQGSKDGVTFETLDKREGIHFSEHEEKKFTLSKKPEPYTYYRLEIEEVTSGDRIHLAIWALQDESGKELLAPYDEIVTSYVSAWMSAGNQEEWIYIDLGTESKVHRVKIYWGSMYATNYKIQVSENAKDWHTVAVQQHGQGGEEELCFEMQTARYVKLLLIEPVEDDSLAYIVREFEVYGTNELEYQPEKPKKRENGKWYLDQNDWEVQRLAPKQSIEEASNKDGWLPAIVPGTVFLSYLKAGAVADPCYADWQRCASDSYFKSDFLYRTRFTVPKEQRGKYIWLQFDAINWKADVFLNGTSLGQIQGGFTRGRFLITPYVLWEEENLLVVKIHKNRDPGTAYTSHEDGPGTMGGVFGNDGRIGEDAPTYSAANGWDWVPTVRGRNIGIYNDVFLEFLEAVELIDPWMVTTFVKQSDGTPDLNQLELTLKTEVKNHSDKAVVAAVCGKVAECDSLCFSAEVTLEPFETKEIVLGPLLLTQPAVWWPNGYGDQPLYHASVTATVAESISDKKELTFGAREFTYLLEGESEVDFNGYQNGERLTILCNGERIIIRGGNWGLEDIHLNVDQTGYDDKIKLHKYANFNIIRNWGGQINDPELYRACDRYGILIWDDFFIPGCWLHLPTDTKMFLSNVQDKIKQYRGHACIALYCGANEAYPEIKEIEDGIREYVRTLDGTRHYIPNSAKPPVAEDGPHSARLPEFYFTNTPSGQMISERGMPNLPVAETMHKIFPEEKLWPVNSMWALHDFALRWNVDGAGYLEKLKSYGEFDSFDEMLWRAQLQGYELHKAMFEGAICAGSLGLMMWMSNAVWTSLVWQSYDYFHDVNGGYLGLKTGCQPINCIWNCANNKLMLFHATNEAETVNVQYRIYDINGKLLDQKNKSLFVDRDSLTEVFSLDFTNYNQEIIFLKTQVFHQDGKIAGENFYWHNPKHSRDFSAIASLKATLPSKQLLNETVENGIRKFRVLLKNNSDAPVFMTRLKLINRETKKRIVPVFYEDGYISLMPGEEKETGLEVREALLSEIEPELILEPFRN